MRRLALMICLTLFSTPGQAYFSLMDTGNLKDEGEHRILGEGQVLMDAPEGFNLNARFATGLTEDSEIQFEGGVGSVDYYLGAFWKWIPFPDTVDQPAIGGRMGVVFADLNNLSTYGVNVTPMISKSFDTNYGDFTPYGGIEMGLLNNVSDTFFSMQAIAGLEWKPNKWDYPALEDMQFLIEYGFEVDDAFDYLSFGASYDF